MEMKKVDSSNLSKIGYDPEQELLVVEFVKGARYEYKGVPADIYKMLMNADSKGSAFHRFIRSNEKYKYKRVK